MKLIQEWLDHEISETFEQCKKVEAQVIELKKKYKTYKLYTSPEYNELPAYLTKMAEWGSKYQLEQITKDVQTHFDKLQLKVMERIGEIKEIQPLGGDDYLFKGEAGEVGVMVVMAGGWNVQRLHTRWIFDRRKKKMQ